MTLRETWTGHAFVAVVEVGIICRRLFIVENFLKIYNFSL
jgi:hypothetical protein